MVIPFHLLSFSAAQQSRNYVMNRSRAIESPRHRFGARKSRDLAKWGSGSHEIFITHSHLPSHPLVPLLLIIIKIWWLQAMIQSTNMTLALRSGSSAQKHADGQIKIKWKINLPLNYSRSSSSGIFSPGNCITKLLFPSCAERTSASPWHGTFVAQIQAHFQSLQLLNFKWNFSLWRVWKI